MSSDASDLDRRKRHHIACDDAPAAVMRASEGVSWREVPIFRGLMVMITPGRPRFSSDS